MYQLKEARMKAKMKQKEVATLLNITPATYSRYESGQIDPDPRTLIKLSEYFGTTVDELLVKDKPKQPEQWELQMFSNNAKVAELSGEILSMKDDKKIALTVDILNRIKTMSTEQVEALNIFLSKIK